MVLVEGDEVERRGSHDVARIWMVREDRKARGGVMLRDADVRTVRPSGAISLSNSLELALHLQVLFCCRSITEAELSEVESSN